MGLKVHVPGYESHGVGEIASLPGPDGTFEVRFYRSPARFQSVRVPRANRTRIQQQTRCFQPLGTGWRVGRVVQAREVAAQEVAHYFVAFPNAARPAELAETEFHVRSLHGAAEPAETLACLAHETPFFFERRTAWLDVHDAHAQAHRGVQSLSSAAVGLLPHQAEAVRRVLQDPCVRYLLADEVGLGKTIEAGAILRQLLLDCPSLRCAVFVPRFLVDQWKDELESRFGVTEVPVLPHGELPANSSTLFDLVVVDEAHRLLAEPAEVHAPFRKLCHDSKHLLLLSATPLLHREQDLLGLLNLLDPERHRLNDLEGFLARLEKRVAVGRSLLALARATAPIVIQRQARFLAALVPDDEVVRDTLASAPVATGPETHETWAALAVRLREHVAETWRLHRRLIRARRATVIQEGDLRRLRNAQPPEYLTEYAPEEAIQEVWTAIEDFRVAAAGRAARGEMAPAPALDGYLRLAQAVVFPEELRQIAEEAAEHPDLTACRDELRAVALAARGVPPTAAFEALQAMLDVQEAEAFRWVVFCGSAGRAAAAAAFLQREMPDTEVLCLHANSGGGVQAVLSQFAEASGRTCLLVDASAEEGLNLQAAHGLVLLDLPFDPMRLEQRIGRLDRLTREGLVQIIALLSVDDREGSCAAFDRAWYETLSEGLGLFSDSIADVPFVLERQMASLAQDVFQGGPQKLYARAHGLKDLLAAERTANEEQDVLDGTFVGGVRGSDWWKALQAADFDERGLREAFLSYLEESVALEATPADDVGGIAQAFTLSRNRRRDVLIPADRLTTLPLTASALTFNRRRAVVRRDAELIRPGHPLSDWMRRLAEWDDRGRAFVVSRSVPGRTLPQVVTRVVVRASLDDGALDGGVPGDRIAEGARLRLAANWFPRQTFELFLMPDGSSAGEQLQQECRSPYDKRHDLNLGGERAPGIFGVVSASDWPSFCRRMSEVGLEQAGRDPRLLQGIARASEGAREFFARQQSHARLRQARGFGSNLDEQALAAELERVEGLIRRPRVAVDAIGVYVLCATRSWMKETE